MTKESIVKYSKTILEIGVNLQKNQILMISTPLHACDVAYTMATCAYEMGARRVIIDWRDATLSKLRYQYETVESLCDIFDYEVASKNDMIDLGICRVAIASDDPEAFEGCDSKKIAEFDRARSKKLAKFSKAQMTNQLRWCVCSVPEEKWAKKVFPNLSVEEGMEELWNMIQKTMLLDTPDPVQAWKDKCEKMHVRCKFLNDSNFTMIHYKNSLGTDLHVKMMSDSIWHAADEKAQDGLNFIANLPTEEIYSAPHRLGTNGILYSALPLCHNGNIIDKFHLEFCDGKIVNFSAEIGDDFLKNIIETDEGSHYLGEIALVQFDSPISNLKTLFFNTLFDENASCHFAIGEAYASCCASGLILEQKELLAHGVNDSLTHIDFMVGTPDLSIVGETTDGKMINIIIDGNFVI